MISYGISGHESSSASFVCDHWNWSGNFPSESMSGRESYDRFMGWHSLRGRLETCVGGGVSDSLNLCTPYGVNWRSDMPNLRT